MSYALAEKISSATAIILPDARHMMPVEHACEVSALLHKFVAANSR
jgi:pimeloyl-ACP methyl ester carboxylesterase